MNIERYLEWKGVPIEVEYNDAGRGFYRIYYRCEPLPIDSFKKDEDAWGWLEENHELVEFFHSNLENKTK